MLDAALARLNDDDRSAVVLRYMQKQTVRGSRRAAANDFAGARQRISRAAGSIARVDEEGGRLRAAGITDAGVADGRCVPGAGGIDRDDGEGLGLLCNLAGKRLSRTGQSN